MVTTVLKAYKACKGTCNVRTMAQTGNIQKAIKEIEQLKLKVLRISKIRWTDENYCDIEEQRIHYSGAPNK